MVDFSKRLGKRDIQKPLDPVAIYDTLDRASDKGELRRVQVEVLEGWHTGLPIPYWDWRERSTEIVNILSKKVAEEGQKLE